MVAAAAAPAAAAPDRAHASKPKGKKMQNFAEIVTKKSADEPMDPRFAAAQTDPRFERFPDKRREITIDPRFAGAQKEPKTVSQLPRWRSV